jgi:hypothetical protein
MLGLCLLDEGKISLKRGCHAAYLARSLVVELVRTACPLLEAMKIYWPLIAYRNTKVGGVGQLRRFGNRPCNRLPGL